MSASPLHANTSTVLGADSSACGRLCRAALFLGVGLTAGVVAFYAIGIFGNSFQLPEEILPLLAKDRLTEAEFNALVGATRTRSYLNTSLSVAILGGVTGALLGLAAGVARGKTGAVAVGLIGGAVLGTLFGGLAGFAELFTARQIWTYRIDATYKAMVAHSIAFAIAGIGIGIAAGMAHRRVPAAVGVVLAAALISGLIYPGIAAMMFPVENTDAVVPPDLGPFTFAPLTLWTLLPTALMGLGLGRIKAALPPN